MSPGAGGFRAVPDIGSSTGAEKISSNPNPSLPPGVMGSRSKVASMPANGAHSINNDHAADHGDGPSEDGSTGDWGDLGEVRVPSENNSVDTDVTTDTSSGSNGTQGGGRRPAAVVKAVTTAAAAKSKPATGSEEGKGSTGKKEAQAK